MDVNGGHHFAGDDHPQALAFTPNMECIWVDELIAPVLEAAWREGLMTYNSCQGDEVANSGYIMFEHRPYTEEFVRCYIANELREVIINENWGLHKDEHEYVDLFYWDGEVILKR